ncbi:MAG: MinD/ParA family protein [Kiloniellales bacterium]
MVQAITELKPRDTSTTRNLIAVASGKGGVGKTWLSITLSHALAKLGKRVLLFDGDLGLANVDVQLGLAAQRDLGGVMNGEYPLSAAVVKVPHADFDVIAGRSGTSALALLGSDRLTGLIGELSGLSQSYDLVLLDLGAGVERTVRQLALIARSCLVVTTDEPTALTDAYAFIKLALQQRASADLRVVVNMAASEKEGERTYATLRKACQSFLQATPPLAGILRRDSRVKDAIRAQTPLLQRYPTADVAKDIERLAHQLIESS